MDEQNNTPPPWSEAPPWAKWRAQDEDGSWFWYSEKPIEKEDMFDSGGKILLCKWSSDNPNWKTTMQKRPENE